MIAIKPEGLFRGCVGDILRIIENTGSRLFLMKIVVADNSTVAQHLIHKKDKPYYKLLVDTYINKPMLVSVWEGAHINNMLNKHKGKAAPAKGDAACLRFMLSISKYRNCIHCSESNDEAQHDIGVWFN